MNSINNPNQPPEAQQSAQPTEPHGEAQQEGLGIEAELQEEPVPAMTEEPAPKKARSPKRLKKEVDVLPAVTPGKTDKPSSKKESPKGVNEPHSASPKTKGKGKGPEGTPGYLLYRTEVRKDEPRKLVREMKDSWEKMSDQERQVRFRDTCCNLIDANCL